MQRSSQRIRVHNRKSFFKYMTASTARIVLGTRTLRWSSPFVFNDPFDTPRELAFGVGPADVANALSRRLTALIEHPPDDVTWLTPGIRLIVEMAKRGLSPGLKTEMTSAIIDAARMPSSAGGSLDELRTLWRGFLPDFRILCLTEDPSSASMWHHYAGGFSGVVLELECREELDSPWFEARPVTYATRAADMFNADELAQIILMPQPKAREAILDWATFRKSPEWSNEKEWRVVSSKRPTGTGHFTDFPFHPEESRPFSLVHESGLRIVTPWFRLRALFPAPAWSRLRSARGKC